MNQEQHPFPRIRRSENLHILFWLIKDSCWMLEFRLLGTLMIIPTVLMAVWILWISRKQAELFINLAVLFWIIANAAWMLMEFFAWEEYKLYTGIPFSLGLLSVLVYYTRAYRAARQPIS